MNTKKLTKVGLVAAIYVVLTWILPMFSYGPIQFRISEILTLLAFYNPIYVLSITIGAFISNIISPLGIIDMFVGALHSFLSVYAMTKTKNIYLASIFPALFSFIIAIEILIVSDEKLSFFLITGQIMLSEFIIVSLIGVSVFKLLEKNKTFKDFVLLDGTNKVK